jgi:hypothetical protein
MVSMANHYTQFSTSIQLTLAQAAWAQATLTNLEIPKEQGGEQVADEPLGFTWVIRAIPGTERKKELVMYSEESGNVESVVGLVQRMMRKFPAIRPWGMEWAYTCSKPRVGEFGGGAVFVTRKGTKWHSTSAWLRPRVEGHSVTTD